MTKVYCKNKNCLKMYKNRCTSACISLIPDNKNILRCSGFE